MWSLEHHEVSERQIYNLIYKITIHGLKKGVPIQTSQQTVERLVSSAMSFGTTDILSSYEKWEIENLVLKKARIVNITSLNCYG